VTELIAPKKPSQECAIPDSDEPLRQGDIVCTESAQPTDFAQIYVIATADCDLANEKHFGRLLAFPIIPLEHYFMQYRVSKIIDDIQHGSGGLDECSLEVLGDMLNLAEQNVPKDHYALDWLRRTPVSEILNSLEAEITPLDNSASKIADLRRAALRLEPLVSLLNSPPDMTKRTEVCRYIDDAKAALGQKLKKGANAYLDSELRSFASKNTPRDAFLISSIPPLPSEPPGYVVALRFPEQLTTDEIATRRVRKGQPSKRFLRQSRVVWPYSTALMSQFASLYTAVGLPDDYRSTLQLVVDMISDAWQKET
jgi:hypothetical protein